MRTLASLDFASKSSRSITSFSVTSTKTGIAPTEAIAPGTGASVKALVRTLSPYPIPNALRAVDKAYPPEATAKQ